MNDCLVGKKISPLCINPTWPMNMCGVQIKTTDPLSTTYPFKNLNTYERSHKIFTLKNRAVCISK